MDSGLQVQMEDDGRDSRRELDGVKWFVVCAALEVARHKSNQSKLRTAVGRLLLIASITVLSCLVVQREPDNKCATSFTTVALTFLEQLLRFLACI